MRIILVALLCFVSINSDAQDIGYVRQHAENLSSSKMYGRGYVKGGMTKAAKYLSSEYQNLGLRSFGKDYYQEFTYGVNSFPKKIFISVNGKLISAGKDFLVSPESGNESGSFEVVEIGKNDLQKLPHPSQLAGKIIMLNNRGLSDKDSLGLFYQLREDYAQLMPVIWVNNNRLVYSVARRNFPHCIIEVNPDIVKAGDVVKLKVKPKWFDNFIAKNVIGYVPGTENPDSFVVFTGHYDHLGMMGKDACFYGANDNASGVAFMLSMAKHYAENPPKHSMVFMAFAGEEAGLIGSKYYTENPLFDLMQIKFLINMDLLGYGEKGITVVNATIHEKEFNYLNQINNKEVLLVRIKKRGEAANSDHYWFEEAGVPSFFIYTMGDNQAYHDVYDKYENLTFGEYEDLFKLIRLFVEKL